MALAGFGDKVEGIHAVAAALEAGRVERLYVERGRRAKLLDLVDSLDPSLVSLVDDVRSMADTDAPQGVVAVCRPIRPATLESLATEDAALLVLDHVEDPHNVGASARSALAAGIGGMVVSSRRAAPLSATAFKAAAGALERLPVAVVGSIPEALSRLNHLGVWVVGLESGAEESLFGLGLLSEPVAVVIGAEGSGLAELTRKRCDMVVSIPMVSGTESLNSSVSAALACFEIMRARQNV
ncbi:MAG TPA: 23S rRNA (guanosine(2251)-2'-O)-methyltransferase RlmB [Acidimicrobiia bacterium]|jgi:23S rRNA (guanosine2251-2'-O)-methyltransferase|nr:23S rRNA (guanosine(2251)-2'-O)-methyltransferase RlmB [Acidimicrobiia bacterium]